MLGLISSMGLPPITHSFAAFTAKRSKTYSASLLRPGNFTGNRQPSCTSSEAKSFSTYDRPRHRRNEFLRSLQHINEAAGGEPRSIRRAMARARIKNLAKLAMKAREARA